MAYIIQPDTYPTAGIATEQVMSLYDVFEPQHYPVLFRRFEEQYMPFFQYFRSLGRETPVANDEWFTHEENWYHRTIKTADATLVGAAPGATVDVTLDAAYHDSKGNSYPREGDIISLPNSSFDQLYIYAKDTTTPNAHVLTLKPMNSAVTIPAIAAGTTLSITNGAFGAGTGQPDATVVGTTKRTFYAQILKEKVGAEGTQLVNALWYKVMDDGKNVKGWYTPGSMRGEYLLSLKIDGAFLWGDESDNVVVPSGQKGAGNAVKTTKGIMRHVSELGKTIQYTSGAFDPTDLDQVTLYLKSQGMSAGYATWFVGAQMNLDVENGMVSYLGQNSAPDYTHTVKTVFKGNNDLAANIGFSVIKKGGIRYMLTNMNSWSNPQTFGAAGYGMPKYGLIIPVSKFTNPKTKKAQNNIETRYRALGNYSRRMEMWNISGAGPGLKVSEIDETNTNFRSHVGLQANKVNQMVMMVPA